jgi:hypothetical protein
MAEPEEDVPPAVKLERLMVVSSAAPLDQPDDEDLSPATAVNPGCDPNKSEYTPAGYRTVSFSRQSLYSSRLDAGSTEVLANPNRRAAHW